MPKPYTIRIDVEEIALGQVMRKLHAMEGVATIHFEFEKEKPNGATRRGRPPNGAHASEQTPKVKEPREKSRGSFDGTGQDLVLQLLKGGKQLSMGEMREGFEALGRSPSSVNFVIHALQKAGKVTRVERDLYRKAPKS